MTVHHGALTIDIVHKETPMTQAEQTKTTFRQSVAIAADIDAPPHRVWQLLTNPVDYPRWNSTVAQIEGQISEGEKIELQTTYSDRIFKLRVDNVEEEKTMTWSDGFAPMFRGVRRFSISPRGKGTRFEMRETFSGLMLPMIKSQLPDFGPIFERYANDLKAAAEGAPQSAA